MEEVQPFRKVRRTTCPAAGARWLCQTPGDGMRAHCVTRRGQCRTKIPADPSSQWKRSAVGGDERDEKATPPQTASASTEERLLSSKRQGLKARARYIILPPLPQRAQREPSFSGSSRSSSLSTRAPREDVISRAGVFPRPKVRPLWRGRASGAALAVEDRTPALISFSCCESRLACGPVAGGRGDDVTFVLRLVCQQHLALRGDPPRRGGPPASQRTDSQPPSLARLHYLVFLALAVGLQGLGQMGCVVKAVIGRGPAHMKAKPSWCTDADRLLTRHLALFCLIGQLDLPTDSPAQSISPVCALLSCCFTSVGQL
ncbi:hypothetical protein AAFF_G00389400 [Aldrovandia affinis]|uniref:Uncharacterized protein n=1 Tax=Aldrovandia affinis TaxID=143900 RepID=A0AAD7SEN6_9TELE|nr:hypothetical protein AAFF_G00389400 [Aldrovandia affinis]